MSSPPDKTRQTEAARLLGALQREIGAIHGEPILRRFRRWRDVRSPGLRMEQQAHDPAWAGAFADAARDLSIALIDIDHRLHHVGSTAVPGLRSKPIIDMALALARPDDLDRAADALVRAGYADWGNSPAHPDVRWYWHAQREPVQRVVHLCAQDCPWIAGALNFRDYLRAVDARRDEYAALKQQLAAAHDGDITLYSLRKAALLYRINLEANAWRAAGGADR